MHYNYNARITVDPDEIRDSFTIIVFLGPIPEDPKDWLISPSQIGSFSVMRSLPGRRRRSPKSEGFVQLPNHIILKRSGLKSLEPDVILPYLSRELKWRAQKSDVECTPVTLSSLEVEVVVCRDEANDY